jgi:cytochrome c peroxidase
MATERSVRAALVVGLLLASAGCGAEPSAPEPLLQGAIRRDALLFGIGPLGPAEPQNAALVDLGRSLFFDKILSGNRDVSCGTCHDPRLATTDARSLAVGTGAVLQAGRRVPGVGREYVSRNAPSLLNLRDVEMLMWDGRIRETAPGVYATPAGAALPQGLTSLLAAQAMFPVLARTELRGDMGDRDVFGAPNELARYDDGDVTSIWNALMRRLLAVDGYVARFEAAYPDIPTDRLGFEHAANAIAAFELEAFTRVDTPFDRYLRGDDRALSSEATSGVALFLSLNCQYCHFGAQLGGQQLSVTGVPQLGPGTGSHAPLDGGADAPPFAFRVPPLRNVELTAPYGHAGPYATLAAMVRHYPDVREALRSYDTEQLEPDLQSSYHGDVATREQLLARLDERVGKRIPLGDDGVRKLVAFLESLTDPSARNLEHLVPSSVPSGLPVR